MKKIIFTLTFVLISVLIYGQSVTMTINGAYADSSGNARNSKKLQGKDSTALLSYTKALITRIPALPSSVQGDLLYASGTNTWAKLAKNTTASRYLSNSGPSNNPVWAPIDLNSGVSGTLNYSNGGTNATSQTNAKANLNYWGYNEGTIAQYYLPSAKVYLGNVNTSDPGLDIFLDANEGGSLVTFNNLNDSPDYTSTVLNLALQNTHTSLNNAYIRFINSIGNYDGSITKTESGISLNTTSDSTLKTNIRVTKYSIKDLMKLRPVDFAWKSDVNKKRMTGFLAQEVYDIYPDAVLKPLNNKDKWQMSREALVPLLVKSIQDQQAEISDLTKRIEKLEKLIKK
jgi:Chaperone of endosialidase